MNKKNKTMILVLTALMLLGIAQASALCTPFPVQGEVTQNGQPADGATVTLTDTNNGGSLLDTVGITGNSQTSGWYAFDLGGLTICAANGDNITIEASLAGATGSTSFLYDAAAGFKIPTTIILTTPLVCTDNDQDTYFAEGGQCGLADCNDNNASINPGATDTDCNGIDENCDTVADDGYVATPTNCGTGACASTGQLICSAGTTQNTCNPGTPTTEICDGIDNDCNGAIDNGVLITFYQDSDTDTYGNNAITQQACTPPNGFVADNTDCNDASAAINPGATDTNCNGIDENCDTIADEGYIATQTNCGVGSCAAAGLLNCVGGVTVDSCVPGNSVAEVCDGLDNDCNGIVDNGVLLTFYQDFDLDTYGDAAVSQQACVAPNGFVADNTDCNDASAAINPGATEILCDSIDQDCSGADNAGTDTDLDTYKINGGLCGPIDCNDNNAAVNPAATEICDDTVDNNCNSLIDASDPACQAQCTDADFDGYAIEGAGCGLVDCNDANTSINPGASDANCNGVDENCDTVADDSYVSTSTNCGIGACASTGMLSCVGGAVTDSCTPGSPIAEICDGLDNDCNGAIDNGVLLTFYQDADADTYGNLAVTQQACTAPNGYVADSTDCNDANVAINPAASDANCNNVDENCNGQADEGFVPTLTNCGVGACASTGMTGCSAGVITDSCVAGSPVTESCNDAVDNDCNGLIDCLDTATCALDPACVAPPVCTDNDQDTYFAEGGQCGLADCNDNNAAINPGATDNNCNGVDENCDSVADEGYIATLTNCGIGACAATGQLICTAGTTQNTCNPGTPTTETCNDAIDNNCNGLTDCADTAACSSDPACVSPPVCTDADQDTYAIEGAACGLIDCNDANAAINPGAIEVCDSIDNNCNGQIDECSAGHACSNSGLCLTDSDGDGIVDIDDNCISTPNPGQADCNNNNLGDACDTINPDAQETCGNKIDDNCNGKIDESCITCTDYDKDGYFKQGGFCGPKDCNDYRSSMHPGATELCNGRDDDCDGKTDESCITCTDYDHDGFFKQGGACGPKDCNDYSYSVKPGATEKCNGKDDNCNNKIDEIRNCGPFVISTVPENDKTGVNRNANIKIVFSENVSKSTINYKTVIVKDQYGNRISGAITVKGDDIWFNPKYTLRSYRKYVVTVKKNVKDLYGNAMLADYVFRFKTGYKT